MGANGLSAEVASHRPSKDYVVDFGLSGRANLDSVATTCTYMGYETRHAHSSS
jgi:hypothetical protein